jgi:hypothetical protein
MPQQALVLASPTPGKFLSLVRVVGCYPGSFERSGPSSHQWLMLPSFVVHKSTGLPFKPSSDPSSSEAGDISDPTDATYMFALRIHDDTAFADAIVFGNVSHLPSDPSDLLSVSAVDRRERLSSKGCQPINSLQITESERS